MRSRKFKNVEFSNKKKQVTVTYRSGDEFILHYGSLGFSQNLQKAWVDKDDTNSESIGFEFVDGQVDYMPYDEPLVIVKDPEYMLQLHIEQTIAQIKKALKQKGISKSYLAKHLSTSENQIHRLLNPALLNKNLHQLYKIAALLNLNIEVSVKEDVA